MMSRKEFNEFLKETGGLIHSNGKLPDSFRLFGIECDEGWLELIDQLIHELSDGGWPREINQIKEKFGGLRFYADGLPENGHEIIARYQKRSYEMCDIYGSTDKVSLCGQRWLETLCDQRVGPWLVRH